MCSTHYATSALPNPIDAMFCHADTGDARSLWAQATRSNAAVALLMAGDYLNCAEACKKCIEADASFLPPYLHLARARRCMGEFTRAQEVLLVASKLADPAFVPAIQREAHLLLVQEKDRTLGALTTNPSTFLKPLGLTEVVSGQRLLDAFRMAIIPWHPQAWADASTEEQAHAAGRFHACVQAFVVLNDPPTFRAWQAALQNYNSIHEPPHLRHPWVYASARVQVALDVEQEQYLRQVPLFSPLSLPASRGRSMSPQRESPSHLSGVASIGVGKMRVSDLVAELPALRVSWTWAPPPCHMPAPGMPRGPLLELVDRWKADQARTMPLQQRETEKRNAVARAQVSLPVRKICSELLHRSVLRPYHGLYGSNSLLRAPRATPPFGGGGF